MSFTVIKSYVAKAPLDSVSQQMTKIVEWIAADAGPMIPVKHKEGSDFLKDVKADIDAKKVTKPLLKLGTDSGHLVMRVEGEKDYEKKVVIVKGFVELKEKRAKATVVNAQLGDSVIDKSTKTMADARGVKADTLASADLSNITGDLIILAHGGSKGSTPGKVYCNSFGDKSVSDIVKYLTKTKPLPLAYSGVVYLDGCFTAAGASKGTSLSDLNNFAGKVYKGLESAGYRYLQVKGNLGEAATNADGSETVKDAQADAAIKKNQAMLKPFDDKLKQAGLAMGQSINDIEKKYGPAMAKLEKVLDSGPDSEKKAAQENLAKLKAAKKKDIDAATQAYDKVQKATFDAYRKVGAPTESIRELVGTFGPAALPS